MLVGGGGKAFEVEECPDVSGETPPLCAKMRPASLPGMDMPVLRAELSCRGAAAPLEPPDAFSALKSESVRTFERGYSDFVMTSAPSGPLLTTEVPIAWK